MRKVPTDFSSPIGGKSHPSWKQIAEIDIVLLETLSLRAIFVLLRGYERQLRMTLGVFSGVRGDLMPGRYVQSPESSIKCESLSPSIRLIYLRVQCVQSCVQRFRFIILCNLVLSQVRRQRCGRFCSSVFSSCS